MILKNLSVMWAAITPELGNHLWQSTLFAIITGLLTLVLHENHAGTRYRLWLAASVKFFIPFSLLAGIGSHLALSRGPERTKAGLYFAMEEISQPFTQPTMSVISRATPPPPPSVSLIHLLPALLAAVWLCGFVVVLCVWYARWRRVSAIISEAAPLREGREVEALRRVERSGGTRKRIEMLSSRASLEPGIFGIARPVLVWPEGISERLEDAHLEAILTHELWHARRRDNLAAAVHMVVEAVFWFYPVVWWLGERLMEERERACDEEVLELGSERQVYAESILKVCEFCVGSPLACVSGVTGADLKRRMVYIMTERTVRKLDFSRKLLLSVAGLLAVAAPIGFGLLSATPGRAQAIDNATVVTSGYQDVSIKSVKSVGGFNSVRMLSTPDGFTATGVTLQGIIQQAYGLKDNQISGVPNWVNSERYDIEAKVDKSAGDQLQKLSPDQRNLAQQRMLQVLLADRFKLTVHHETKVLPGYALVIAGNGPKLQESKRGETYPNGFTGPDRGGEGMMRIMMNGRMGQLTGRGTSVTSLVEALSGRLGRNVLDKTGLNGHYDFTLQWPTTEGLVPRDKLSEDDQQGTDSSSSSGPSIFTAIQEQLGLKLEPQRAPMEILVIDHAEMPSEN